MKLSLYHIVALSAAVSISLVWVYWKMNKLEKQVREIGARVNTNTTTLTNLTTAMELCNAQDNQACVLQHAPEQPLEEVATHVEVQAPQAQPQDVPIPSQQDNMSISSEDVNDVLKTMDASPTEKDSQEQPLAPEAPLDTPEIDDALLNQLNDPKNWIFTEDELKKKTVEELKSYLSEKSLSIKGNKKELVQRILENHQ